MPTVDYLLGYYGDYWVPYAPLTIFKLDLPT